MVKENSKNNLAGFVAGEQPFEIFGCGNGFLYAPLPDDFVSQYLIPKNKTNSKKIELILTEKVVKDAELSWLDHCANSKCTTPFIKFLEEKNYIQIPAEAHAITMEKKKNGNILISAFLFEF